MDIKNAFIMLIVLSTVVMVGGGTGNVIPSDTTTATITQTDTSTNSTPTMTETTVETTETTVETTVVVPAKRPPGKFRVGPTVRIRPLNDEINKNQDGLIEIYMDNPSLNDIPLSVDARLSVPSGIHVYGEGFGEASAAGMVYGKFEIPPGSARTINIVIKAEKIGDFSAQFSGLYWPGDNKDAYQPISLTHPFKVTAPSKDPLKDTSSSTGGDNKDTQKPPEKSPGISMIVAISIVIIMAYILRRRN